MDRSSEYVEVKSKLVPISSFLLLGELLARPCDDNISISINYMVVTQKDKLNR